jgi:hypothetical protein
VSVQEEGVPLSEADTTGVVYLQVQEAQAAATRLISRNRIAMKGAAAGQRLGMLVMEPGSLVMERKMLLGIKRRAEKLAAERSSQALPDPKQ